MPELIEMQPLNPPPMVGGSVSSALTSEAVLKKLVKKLQEQEKVFPEKSYPNPESILHRMDILLDPIISGSLCDIYSTSSNIPFVELLCHAFFHQRKHNDSEKSGKLHTKIIEPLDQLYGVLVAAYISNIMREIDNDEEEFKTNHRYFEDAAYEIFDELYKSNKRKLEYHILAYDYESKFRKSNDYEWEDSSRELLCVAYRGKCMKFLSHPACQNYIKTRWRRKNINKLFEPGNRVDPPKTTAEFNLPSASTVESAEFNTGENSSPHTLEMGKTERRTKLKESCALCGLYIISPQAKYIIHMILNALFVALFALILIVKPYRGKYAKGSNPIPRFWSYIFGYVVITLGIDLIMQGIKIWWIYKKSRNYWWDFVQTRSIRAIILTCTTFYTTVWLLPFIQLYPPLVGFLTGLSELIYNTAFVITAASLLKYLSFIEYFGNKIELIKKMANSIINYMLLLLFFWIIYAVVYLSLTETIKYRNETTMWLFFEKGAFEILGEPQERDRNGDVDRCNVLWDNINWTLPEEASCLFRSTLLPPVLLIYMFVAAVMLINVFTAMLSHEYEKTEERSKNYINFHRYHMLVSFESKFLLPAPFNALIFISWAYKLVAITINSCFRPCMPIIRDMDPWKWLITPQGISPKVVTKLVNEAEIKKRAQKVLERKGKHNFIRTVQDYLNSCEQNNPSADGGIEEAGKILQGVIQKFREYLSAQTIAVQERLYTWAQDEMERRSTIGSPPPNTQFPDPAADIFRKRWHSGGPVRSRAWTTNPVADDIAHIQDTSFQQDFRSAYRSSYHSVPSQQALL